MKLYKNIFLAFILVCLSIFLVGCPVSVQNGSQPQNREQIQQIKNIYFDYPVRDYPIGKSNDSTLYWDCSENYFCDTHNGKYHSAEDWNLKGASNDKDEGKSVYSIGDGKVIYAKEEKVGFRVVIEHTGTCVIPAKKNIEGSNVSYKEEVVDKIYSVYLHLKDVQVSVGDEVDINKVIGKIKMYDPEVPPHLHFEIRKDSKIVFESYFENIQEVIDRGFRDPSEFIEANKISNKVIIGSSQTIPEQNISIETETITVEENELTQEASEQNIFKESLDKIVFTSNRTGNFEIFTMNWDGTNIQQLTNSEYDDINPSLSLKGDKIVFDSWGKDYHKIYIMNTDGTELTLLKDDVRGGYPTWLPDGKKIAFESWEEDTATTIDLINIESGDTQQFMYFKSAEAGGIGSTSPSWSPDGRNVSFVKYNEAYNIYIKKLDSGTVTLIRDDVYFNLSPAWSPDSKKIAFESLLNNNLEICVMNNDGTNVTNLTNDPSGDYKPTWSKDGKKIAFASVRTGYFEIFVMNTDGTGLKNLTNNKSEDYFFLGFD